MPSVAPDSTTKARKSTPRRIAVWCRSRPVCHFGPCPSVWNARRDPHGAKVNRLLNHASGSSVSWYRLRFQFSVAATFTADPLKPVLSFWGRQVDSDFAVRFAGYNQVQQALLDPAGEFARNTHGVNVALVRIEDLAQFSGDAAGTRHAIEENFEALLKAVRSAGLRLPAPLIVGLCPPSDAAPHWLDKVEALR